MTIENETKYGNEKYRNWKWKLISCWWVTIICITTINKSTLTKKIWRTWCATWYTTFGDLRWLTEYTIRICLRRKKNQIFKNKNFKINKFTTQTVCAVVQVASDTNDDELSKGTGHGLHCQQSNWAEPKFN